VTVVELLSPANKAGDGYEIYKRNQLMARQVHLVELDLLLKGKIAPMVKPLPRGDYHYLITRSEHCPDCEVYAWNLPDTLPKLPVPLLAPDGDVICDLQKYSPPHINAAGIAIASIMANAYQ